MTQRDDEPPSRNLDELRKRYAAGEDTGRELFMQVSHIAIYLSFDLLDKLRFYEKETLKLTDEEIDERIPHLTEFLGQLQVAYELFADVDI